MTRTSGEVTVAGVVEDVLRFRASTDGIGMMKVRDKEKKIRTVIGTVEGVAVKDFITATGTEREHPTHGLQLRANKVKVSFPTDKESAVTWMCQHFSFDPLPLKLTIDDWYEDFATLGAPTKPTTSTTPGEGDFELRRLWVLVNARAVDVARHFGKYSQGTGFLELTAYVQQKLVMDALVDEGLDTKEAYALFRRLGIRAAEAVREDPFTVYYYVENANFEKIDKIYLRQAHTLKSDDRRVCALCLQRVREFVENGDTAVLYDDLIDLLEEKHEYLSARKVIENLHDLVPDLLTFYGADTFGIRVQPAQLAQFEEGFAQWIVTGEHPERIDQKDVDDDDPEF